VSAQLLILRLFFRVCFSGLLWTILCAASFPHLKKSHKSILCASVATKPLLLSCTKDAVRYVGRRKLFFHRPIGRCCMSGSHESFPAIFRLSLSLSLSLSPPPLLLFPSPQDDDYLFAASALATAPAVPYREPQRTSMARFTQCPQHLSRCLRTGWQHGNALSPFQTRIDPKAVASA